MNGPIKLLGVYIKESSTALSMIQRWKAGKPALTIILVPTSTSAVVAVVPDITLRHEVAHLKLVSCSTR